MHTCLAIPGNQPRGTVLIPLNRHGREEEPVLNPDHKISEDDVRDQIWALADEIGVCMFVTWDGERQRARPETARPRPQDNAIYFLVDKRSAADSQIERFPIVTLTFADNSGQRYLTVSGRATVSDNREKIGELFKGTDRAWFESKDDPNICLVTVRPDDADLWGANMRHGQESATLVASVPDQEPAHGSGQKLSTF
jgi:general stress protein 26